MTPKTRYKDYGPRTGLKCDCEMEEEEVAGILSGPKLYAVVSDCSFSRHHTAQEAFDSATDKAVKSPGVKFYVLKPTDVLSVELPPVKVEAYVKPEDLPADPREVDQDA